MRALVCDIRAWRVQDESFNFRLAITELFFRVWGILYPCTLLVLCGSVVGQAMGTLTVQRTNGRLRANTSQTVVFLS